MLLRSPGAVNAPVFEQTQSPMTGSVQIDFTRTSHEKSGSPGTSASIQQTEFWIRNLRGTTLGRGGSFREDKVGLTAQCLADAFHDSFQMSSGQFGVNRQ